MENLLNTLQSIIYEITGKQGITYETDLVKDLQLNSFDLINIVCACEKKFHITIETREIWKLHRIKDVISYLKDKGVQ